MFWHTSREKHGIRAWWHFHSQRNRCISVELGWWHRFCHVGIECDDDGWNGSIAFPPFFFHLSIEGFPLWQPQYKFVTTWDQSNPTREVWLVDRRECRIAIHDWTIWIFPWSKWCQWSRSNPWWVRGVHFNFKDFILGQPRYTYEPLGPPTGVLIMMPEGTYRATVTPQRQTWKRPRWVRHTRDSFDIEIPKGIPFAGKGENSWDCGDDGLFGTSAEGTLEEAIAKVRESVLASRKRYGMPSERAIAEAIVCTRSH